MESCKKILTFHQRYHFYFLSKSAKNNQKCIDIFFETSEDVNLKATIFFQFASAICNNILLLRKQCHLFEIITKLLYVVFVDEDLFWHGQWPGKVSHRNITRKIFCISILTITIRALYFFIQYVVLENRFKYTL